MPTAAPKQIALIDTSLPDWPRLAASLPTTIAIETFSSLAQLSQWASSHAGEYTALHLFTHGASGKLQLGKETLDASGLNQAGVQGQLQALGQALTPDGDLLLYGCNVADGQGGLEFISQLAQTTQADIAASTNLTGMHGDWALESTYGVLETIPLATDWQGELAMSITPVRMGSPGKAAGEYRNDYAFAALKIDGSVVTWGGSTNGGDSSAVAASLTSGVSQIYSTGFAFAALKSDGSVVTWGGGANGGNSSVVAASLTSNVSQIYSTGFAFAAVKNDGSVVTWGDSINGGSSSAVSASLASGVSQISSTAYAFAALKNNGSVVTWGDGIYGGNSSAVAASLTSGVSQIYSTGTAFAALKSDGSVVAWGHASYGGNSSAVAASLTSGVSQIYSTGAAFAALKSDGSVVTWGDGSYGGNSSAVAASLSSGVSQIYSAGGAFAALKNNGSVVTWGDGSNGGNSSAVAASLTSGVSQVYATHTAFAALKSDGSVVTWGSSASGGNSSAVAASLTSGVSQIYNTNSAFAALKSDGSVVTWGSSSYGGNSSTVAASLTSGVSQIYSTGAAFAALKNDGSVVAWGDAANGGNSSAVAASLASGVVGLANIATDDRYSNSAPTHIALSHSSVAENTSTAGDLTIGALISTDPDTGNTFSYSVVGGTDQARFQVSGANLQFKAGTTLDYETQSSYAVTVRSTDQGGLTYDKTLTVSLSNVNETPTAASFTSAGLDNTTAITGAAVGTLAAVDPDAGDTHTFTLVAGNGSNDADNGKFTLTGNTLKVGGTALAAGTYQVMTRATDAGGLTVDQAQTVTITAANIAPTISSSATGSVAENTATSTVVYTAAATDAESDALTYALTGTDAASFSIDATTGQVRLLTPADFEVKNSYSITVNAKDASHTTTKAVTLNVTDVDEAPSFTSGATGSVAENAATSTVVYTATATDPETGTVTYSLSGTDASAFSIGSSTGVVTLNASADYETKSSYSLSVIASDAASNTVSKTVTISVSDVNEAPTAANFTSAGLTSSTAVTGASVGTLAAVDPDAGDTHTFTLVAGNGTNDADNSKFTIVGNTLKVGTTPLTGGTYQVLTRANDAGGLMFDQAQTIVISTLNAAPVITSGASVSVAENTVPSTVVYTAAATDAESDALSYALTGTDAASFSIDATTGQVRLLTPADFEVKNSYSITVNAKDASHTTTQAVTLNVTDVDEAPSFTSGATGTVAENAATGTVVYTAAASDPETGTVTYSLSGTDASAFSIGSSSGVVTLNGSADYETKSSYSINVIASDAASHTVSKTVTINATNVNEAPTAANFTSAGLTSSTAVTGASVGTLAAVDPDAGDTHTFTLVAGNGSNDADNGKFTVTGNTLKVGGTALTTGTYQVMTRATDAGGLTVDQAQTITISAAGGGGGGGTPTPPDPTPPVTPVTPTTPTVPTEPTTPSVPTTPTEPTTPTVPTTPTTPSVPVDPTPTTPTVPTPPVTPTLPLVDGVIITRYTRARPDGSTVNALTIPVISSERQDQDSSSPQADIALAVLQGQTLLKAEVPTGIGMTVEDLSDSPSRRTDLLDAIKSRTTAQLTDQRHLLDLGQFFLNTLPDAANLWVRTVIISQASNSDASGKLTFRGVSDSSNPSALVLDFTSLPKNSTVALENVQFGAIVGEVSVTTGDGNQLLAADSKAQTLDLGAGNDTVYAGSGNDILNNSQGHDKLFGQGGNDVFNAENGQNILHGGTDSDTAKFTGKADDYTVEKHHGFVKVINKSDPSKSTLVVNSETLQFGDASVAVESAPALNALAGMYQKVLGRQADIDGFDYFGDLQAKGYSMGSMALNMMKTPEGQARGWALTGDPVNDVEMLYQGLLGRASDAGGKAVWVQLLKSGSVSLDQVATAFVESPEMKTHYIGPTGWDFLV